MANAPAHGAALGVREFGAPLNGSAGAGWAALGEDASTAATNPAAMTRLRQSEFLAGPQLLVVDIKFDTAQSSFGGGNGGNAGGVVPAGGLFYVHKVNRDLALGVSAGSYLGFGFEFDDDWAGRYHVTKGEVVTLAGGPSVGYRLNDRWSIGGSVFALYGELDQRAAINNGVTDPGTPDGEIRRAAPGKRATAKRLVDGDVVAVPTGVRHHWVPSGERSLLGVQLYIPPGPEQRFKELAQGQ
mgnify:CR=1 FL=1